MSNLRLLFVDDTPSNLHIVEAYLEPLPIELHLSEQGQDAIALCTTHHFDAIFMDVEMPGMSGLDAAVIIRKQSTAPIIAMTGHSAEHFKQQNLAKNFNGFLGKPFNDTQLIKSINTYCGTLLEATTPNTALTHTNSQCAIGPLDMHAVNQRLKNNTQLIHKILASFANNNQNTYQHFCNALNAHDWTTAKRIAHTLKGGGGNIGANSLANIGAELEKLCEHKIHPSAAQLLNLKANIETVIAQCQCLITENTPPPSILKNTTDSSPKAIKAAMEAILTNLYSDVGLAQDQLDELEQNNPTNSDITQLVALFNEFKLDDVSANIHHYLAAH